MQWPFRGSAPTRPARYLNLKHRYMQMPFLTDHAVDFTLNTCWENLPAKVQHQAKRCLMDTLGALIAGSQTPVADIMRKVALAQFGGDQATIMVSGERVSAAGAALANGFFGNALDIDDGYRLVKGHPGACVLPVILTAVELRPTCTGAEFLTALIIGYELGIRAGRIRHARYETYHSSGSWGAIAGAAAAGRIMGLDDKALRHALGAAEYHAPIAPMMKGIETPSMGKDSIGWGAMVAMLSVLMAREGFTGIEPLFSDTLNPEWIETLGNDWQILNLYFKPYAACRWAQPAVDAALAIKAKNAIDPGAIRSIRIRTFAAACALSTTAPQNTEEAQYNMAFPVAVALLDGAIGPAQVLPPRLFDREVTDLLKKVTMEVHEPYESAFPAKTYADVVIETDDGNRSVSQRMKPRWEPPGTLPTDAELEAKFRWLVTPVLGESSAECLIETIFAPELVTPARELVSLCR
ncbi:MAG: MmgE/PrpD family protein [Desulfobacterales bacterium]|nr:MmgE/PrpD family protein [Desulfobacterales bacterium]